MNTDTYVHIYIYIYQYIYICNHIGLLGGSWYHKSDTHTPKRHAVFSWTERDEGVSPQDETEEVMEQNAKMQVEKITLQKTW